MDIDFFVNDGTIFFKSYKQRNRLYVKSTVEIYLVGDDKLKLHNVLKILKSIKSKFINRTLES